MDQSQNTSVTPAAPETAPEIAMAAATSTVIPAGAAEDLVSLDRLQAGFGVVLSGRDPAGKVVSRFWLSPDAGGVAPEPVIAPSLVTAPKAGIPVEILPGGWRGLPDLALQWLLDDTEIAGANGLSHVPSAADDGRLLSCRVTATNGSGSVRADAPAQRVTRVAPVARWPLADATADVGIPVSIDAAAAFDGAGLTFSVSGPGVRIDSATGLVTISAATLFTRERITVTATNSGGSAESGFFLTVRSSPPAVLTAPALSGTGRIGVAVTVLPGTWSGVPALAFQWLAGGVAIAGATGTTYTPVAADDRKELVCRVTATNSGGTGAVAVTPGLAVTHTPPVVAVALGDVTIHRGAPALVLDAARAFTGEGLVFAVTGAGATVHAVTGRVTVPTGTVRAGAEVTVTATNSGGSAATSFRATVTAAAGNVLPFLLTTPLLAGTGKIGSTLTAGTGSWGGYPAPVAPRQWLRDGVEISGATGASYTVKPKDDGRAICCRVAARNVVGTVVATTAAVTATYVAPTARGLLPEEIFDAGSGLQTVETAADFTGEALRFAVDETSASSGVRVDAATGSVTIPTTVALALTVAVTAANSGGSATSRFPVTVEAEDDSPFPLEAEDIRVLRSEFRPADQAVWFSPSVQFPGLAAEEVAAIEWTTSTAEVVPDSQYEVVARVGTTDDHRLYMRDPARNVPGAKPRVDYSVWRPDETTRRKALRFRWKRTAQGDWSAPSAVVEVPEPEALPEADPAWVPLVARNRMQFEAGEIGGPGMQFLRDFATTPANPDLILSPMDQNFPWQTRDFGETFETPNWNGLWVGRTGVSAWIDPEDADRQLLMYSAGSQSFDRDFDAYSGVYLSTDGGVTCGLVLSMPLLQGTTSSRHNMRLIANAPGGTASTRTIYALQNSRGELGNNAIGTIQLWRSRDGGTSWVQVGGTLPAGTYADGKNGAYGITVAVSGDLYLWTDTGAWRSPAGPAVGTSWSKLSSLPAGKAVHMIDADAGNGVVWAAVDGSGLYTATDGVNFTRNAGLGEFDAVTFAISPADRNYMLATGNKVGTLYSHDGGKSWKGSTTNPALGQEDNFSHKMGNADHYGLVPKQDDRNVWFAQRGQHLGISKDAGRTFEWTGRFYDGSHTREMGFHPTDWQTFAQSQQDRSLVYTATAGDYWVHDPIGGPADAVTRPGGQIAAAIDNKQHISGGGTVIHASGRVITLQGNVSGKRVPCIMQPNGDDPLGEILVVSDAISTISDTAELDPSNPDSAFLGMYRADRLDAASMSGVTFTDITYGFLGATGAGGSTAIFGTTKDKTDRVIRRSTDRGASWRAWVEAGASFRPVDPNPVVTVCPHHPARVYAVSAQAKVVRIEGETNPVETVIFDTRDHVADGHPKYTVGSVAVDPRNEDVLYVSLFMWGTPNVFRSLDRGASWTDISGNVPSLDGVIIVHPLTSDVFFCSSHGTHVLPPPAGQRAAFAATTGSVYDRARTFVGR